MVRAKSPAISVLFALFALLAPLVFAASGDYAFQAKKYLSQGRYGAAYGQYILALKESKKEADLVAEGRILTAMSNLATSAMEYEEAKKLLDKVKVEALDQNGKEDFYRTYMEFYNAQENYNAADEYSQKAKFKEPAAAYLGEQAIAAAGKGKGDVADSLLKKIAKCDSPGQLAYYKARVADLKSGGSSGGGSAGDKKNIVELYEKSLLLSVEKKRYFISGTILFRLAQITGNKEYAARSAAVFNELGLAKPFQKATSLSGEEAK